LCLHNSALLLNLLYYPMSLKQKAAKILRQLGLIYFVDYIRFSIVSFQNSARNKEFLKENPNVAFPPPYMIYETFRLDYRRYYEKGRLSAEWIKNEVSVFKPLVNWHILDWGCGPGRVIRHMPEIVGNGCYFYGSDYNADYIKWCGGHIPGVTFKKNELDPPLQFNSDSMDIIYGISIFTHLSESKHIEWFGELMRVVKKGGILFITTHGDVVRENLTDEECKIYDEGKLVVRGKVKEGHRMYTAYQPISFMQRLLDGRAKILKHKPGTKQDWGYEQDLWILEKL